MRGFAFFGAAVSVAACGISVVGLEPAPSTLGPESGATLPDGAAPSVDGGAALEDGSGPSTDADPGDANVLTPVDGGCLRVIDDSFTATSLDARWKLAGNAKFQNGQVELTQAGDYMGKGALWWTDTLVFGTSLTAVFHYSQFVGTHNPGVGIGIGWVKSNPTWKTGDQGLNVGICNSGLDGVAASLRLAGTTRLDAIVSVSTDCGTNGGLVAPFDLANGILTMKLTRDKVTAISAAATTSQGATVPTSGVVGLTAATGIDSAGQGRFAVTRATVEVCP